jgi:hypothetical protein
LAQSVASFVCYSPAQGIPWVFFVFHRLCCLSLNYSHAQTPQAKGFES